MQQSTLERPRTEAPQTLTAWHRRLLPYQKPSDLRSTAHLVGTFLGFATFWTLSLLSLAGPLWWTALAIVPTTLFLVRLFILQHDCGHYSLFKSSRVCDAVGFFLGIFSITPYAYWRRTHAHHHAHNGDLDNRGVGDIDTVTVREYLAKPRWSRLAYRMGRSPWTLFLAAPLFQFVIKHRFPWDLPRSARKAWTSVWGTNLCIALVVTAMILTVGAGRFFAVQIPVTILSCALGIWLFYVQHQFAHTYWSKHEEWDPVEASLQGSSCLVLPQPLQWMSGNIGLHHVHHLCSRVPHYRLPECMAAESDLAPRHRLTLRQALQCSVLHLWDEESRRLISFRELRRRFAHS